VQGPVKTFKTISRLWDVGQSLPHLRKRRPYALIRTIAMHDLENLLHKFHRDSDSLQ
jgi:hypothetical protein